MRARASANYSGKFYESARTASTGADTRLLLFGGDSADTARGSQYPTPCVEVMHQHHWRIQQPRRGDTENLRLKFPEQRAALRDRIPILVGGGTSPEVPHEEAVLFERSIVRPILMIAAVVLSMTNGVHAQQSYAVIAQNGVAMKTRDGVTLYSDIYRPRADGKFPVILMRTPYDKGASWAVTPAYQIATHGYVVVVQDVRGRYTSEGEWYPFRRESDDGYDAVEWVAALPSSDGRVGMMGGSYVGATQMLAAIAHPPHLAGICPVVTASNYHENWTYTGGAFAQWFNEDWTSGLSQNAYEHLVETQNDPVGGIWTLPLTSYRILNIEKRPDLGSNASVAPYFLDWLAHPSYDDYWKALSIEEHFQDIKVPALHVAAWYDLFLGGSLRNYEGIRAHGGSDEARKGQQLVVVIGGHSGNMPKVGDVDFGPNAKEPEDEWELRYYDYLFKGAKNEFASGKPVKIFVMGANQWRDEAD